MNRPIRALKRTPESGPYTAPFCQCCCSKYECNRSAELNFDSGVSGTFVVFGEVVLDIRKTQRVKWDGHTPFVRAMPDEFKYDDTIDTFTAYKRYIASKPWVRDNYIRLPNRKPEWV